MSPSRRVDLLRVYCGWVSNRRCKGRRAEGWIKLIEGRNTLSEALRRVEAEMSSLFTRSISRTSHSDYSASYVLYGSYNTHTVRYHLPGR